MPRVSFTFRGLLAPVLTPFNNDSTRTLNLSVIPQYANHLANKKVNAVLVNGTSGEGPSMSTSERKLVAEAWASAVRTTKQHLMIQVGGASLPDVLELAKHAESIKADSILCLPELYFKPSTSEQLKDYLRLVSSAAPNTPLLYYHIPIFTNVNVHMGEFLESLNEEIPTFVGIKFTSPNLQEGARALRANNSKFVVFLGNNELMDAACAIGMNSFIITSLSMFPELTVEAFTAGNAGNLLKARETQQRLTKVLTSIGKYGTFIETMKAAMSLLTNINPGPPRMPQQPLSAEGVASMAKDLQNLGFSVNL
ncbi:hypothetical protein K0M31_008031 [Melipona bicolor]|uniref:N-acetylneuraminate lyase n=1 Tax=Melipona bicolor TaxID=60889 RepID=A0AA40GDC3_9HYME|nr:hypothetical protein K0M31_008031 [Melipona bicolor]